MKKKRVSVEILRRGMIGETPSRQLCLFCESVGALEEEAQRSRTRQCRGARDADTTRGDERVMEKRLASLPQAAQCYVAAEKESGQEIEKKNCLRVPPPSEINY